MPRRKPSDSDLEARLTSYSQQLSSPHGLNSTTETARADLDEARNQGLDLKEFAPLIEALEPPTSPKAQVIEVTPAAAPKPKRKRQSKADPAPPVDVEAEVVEPAAPVVEALEAVVPEPTEPAWKAESRRRTEEATRKRKAAHRAAMEEAAQRETELRQRADKRKASKAPQAASAAEPKAKPKTAMPGAAVAAAAAPQAAVPRPVLVGKPLELRSNLKRLDHPTVRFLAAREAVSPGWTFVICSGAPALVGFEENGELMLAPLEEKEKKDATPSWAGGKPLDRLGANLYGPSGKPCLSTEDSLRWIDSHSRRKSGEAPGAFYITSAQEVDPESLLTTMGAATASGLAELYCEWDDLPLAVQEQRIEWLRGLGFDPTVNSSGGKSLHVHIHLSQLLPFEEALPLLKLLCALAGSDHGVVSKARRMRLAGGFRPVSSRLRGEAKHNEQKLIALAGRCYSAAEVQRVLEAEAQARGWHADHLEARWTAYRHALGQLPENWKSATEAWTRSEVEALAWAKSYRSRGAGETLDEPVEWRKDETDLGAKVRHAERELLEKHGLAGAYEMVATSGTLEQRQVAKGYAPGQFEFNFHEDGEKIKGCSPWSKYRAGGGYSGTSLQLFIESQAFHCHATQKKGKLAEFAAYFCPHAVTNPTNPTPDEQLFIARYLWDLAGFPAEEFEQDVLQDEDIENEQRREALDRWENARNDSLQLANVLSTPVADLLRTRAVTFPVHEMAMIGPFLCVMASVLGTRYRVRVKKGHEQPMVLWIGTVAAASSIKTPVADEVQSPLLDLDYEDLHRYKTEKAAWEARSADEKKTEPEAAPQPNRRRIVEDATIEAVTQALSNEASYGLVSFQDELAGWITGFDKYRKSSSDRSQWLSFWSGRALNVSRASKEQVLIPKTAISVFGNIQPAKLAEYLSADNAGNSSGDGFWPRFLWVVPEDVFPKTNWEESEIRTELRELVEALDSLDVSILPDRCVKVDLDPHARALYEEAADHLSTMARQDSKDSLRGAMLEKMKAHIARFAGLLHALDYAEGLVSARKDAEAQRARRAAEIVEAASGGTIGERATARHESRKIATEPLELPTMNGVSRMITGETMQRAIRLGHYFLNQFDTLAPKVGMGDLPGWVVRVLELGQQEGKVSNRDLLRRKWAKDANEARQMLVAMVQKYGAGRLLPAPRKDQTWWSPTALPDLGEE